MFNVSIRALLLVLSVSSTVIFSQTKEEKIDDMLTRYNEYRLFNGSALVADEGEIIFKKGYGFAHIEFDIPNTPETKFRIGSITKQFTATLIMQLVQEGKVNLDSKMTEYLKDYRKDTGNKVTIHHLLTHTSGIPSFTGLPNVWTDSLKHLYDIDYLINNFCSGDLEFEPGSEYRYNNSGYVLLGKIVEEIVGHPLDQVLEERILKPAGMMNTGIISERKIYNQAASGYDKTLSGYRKTEYMDIANAFGAGAMYSTVGDLFLWDGALYTDDIINSESKEKMFTPFLSNYGYGWVIRKYGDEETGDTTIVYTHVGGLNGFNTIIARSVEENFLIVLFNNTGGAPLGEMALEIGKILDGEDYQYPKRSIAEYLYKIIEEENVETALSLYPMLKSKEGESFVFAEAELNKLGYELLRSDRVDEAIEVFKLNIDNYPEAFNVYDSMGEAFMIKGEKQLAIQNYKKSVELNPRNFSGIEKLKELGVDVEEPDEVIVPENVLKDYDGKYKLAPGFFITITTNGKQLFAQATNQSKFEIYPSSHTKFYYKVVQAEIEFNRNEKGVVNELVLYQNGQVLPGEKIIE